MSMAEKVDQLLAKEYSQFSSTIFRDLSLNFKKSMEEGALDETDRLLILLSIATALDFKPFKEFAEQGLQEQNAASDIITEARESAGIMGMLNTYYKFKGYLSPETVENYSRVGLRMQSFMKPISGKEKFEMYSFAVSVVNGCPSCISSHEKALVQLGVSYDKIHDIAKMAAITKGLSSLAS